MVRGRIANPKHVSSQFDSDTHLQLKKNYIMMDKAFELTLRSLSGEELTDDEKRYVRERSAKYELIRHVYIEKMRHDGLDLKNFHFTPGESFMETPIFDIVSGLLKMNEAIKNGDYEVLDFGDSSWKHNPPNTGRTKTTLK